MSDAQDRADRIAASLSVLASAGVLACAIMVLLFARQAQSGELGGLVEARVPPLAMRWPLSGLMVVISWLAVYRRGRWRRLAQPWSRSPARPPDGDTEHRAADSVCALSGLKLRDGMEQRLDSLFAAGQGFGLIIADIDHFRALRDRHGFAAGDDMLRLAAGLLRRHAPQGSLVARIHGDEFCVIVPGADDTALSDLAETLRVALRVPPVPGELAGMTVSLGAARAPVHGDTREAILHAAELALRQAKDQGGDRCVVFRPALARAAEARAALRAELRAALREGQIIPFYQPVMDLRAGGVVGFEVLARWQHPTRGLLLPDDFIALAEAENLCAQLSTALLGQVSADALDWPQDWFFAFNASPGQLHQLLGTMAHAKRTPPDILPVHRLELEVTENVLIEDMDLARRVVEGLHKAGARVVLDDFGTGYANFVHLREIPFDRIKIDKSFVQEMLRNPRTEACVRAMLALAHSLDVSVIAEGVETAEAAQHLRALGCQFAQGYYYAQPVRATQVRALARGLAGASAAA